MGVGFSACRHGGRMPEAGKRSLKASLTSAVTKLLARRPDLVLVKVARKSVFKKELKYFRRNRRRMRYAALGARNLPIGSGVVEATCKSLVSVRMKRGGMRWGQPGGQAVLTLRALRQSGIGNRESGIGNRANSTRHGTPSIGTASGRSSHCEKALWTNT